MSDTGPEGPLIVCVCVGGGGGRGIMQGKGTLYVVPIWGWRLGIYG